MNVMDYLAQERAQQRAEEAERIARPIRRRIPGARRRAEQARATATRRPTPDNLQRADELEAGLARLEAAL